MQLPESIQHTINNLNLQGATVEEIAKDLVEHANQFALRLMVATALLEKLSSNNEGEKHLQPGAQQDPGSV